MATCKDCVHYDICSATNQQRIVNFKLSKAVCKHFKDKSRYIELPCAVGDTVYVIMETSCEDIDLAHTVCEFYNERNENLCTFPRCKCPYKYIIRNCEVDKNNILYFSEKFDKTVFFTREEAEKALKLKEREQE